MSTVALEIQRDEDVASAEWIKEVQNVLLKIKGRRQEYRRALIIKVVQIRLSGGFLTRSLTSVELEDYYYFRGQSKQFIEILEEALQVASRLIHQTSLSALERSQRLLALNSIKAVNSIVQTLASEDERTRLSAAFGLLDRAGATTAAKQNVNLSTDWRQQAKSLGLDPEQLMNAVIAQLMTKTADETSEFPEIDEDE